MTLKKPFVVPLILTSILGAHWALAQHLSADPTGGARVIAIEELKKLPARVTAVPSHSPFFVSDRKLLESATLGEPFVFYWPDSTFLTHYKNAEAGQILRYFRKSVLFPVHAGERMLGTISVQVNENGVWVTGPRTVGDRVVNALEECGRTAAVTAGQRLSILDTGFAGKFGVVEDETRIIAMMPLDEWTRELIESAISPNGESAWILPEQGFPIIQAKVRATRESEQLHHEPIDDR